MTLGKKQPKLTSSGVLKNREALVRSSGTAAGKPPVSAAELEAITRGNGTPAPAPQSSEPPRKEPEVFGPSAKAQYSVGQFNDQMNNYGKKISVISDYEDVSTAYSEGQSLLRELGKRCGTGMSG